MNKVILFYGSFNPVTNGHFRLAKEALEISGADGVIFLPNINPSHKILLPAHERLRMIDVVAADSDTLLYPDPSEGELSKLFLSKENYLDNSFSKKLLEINPNLEIGVVAGDDVASKKLSRLMMEFKSKSSFWVVKEREGLLPDFGDAKVHIIKGEADETSSSKVRKFFSENFENFLVNPRDRKYPPLSYVDKELADYIYDRRFYYSTMTDTFNPSKYKLRSFFKRFKYADLFKTIALKIKQFFRKNIKTRRVDESLLQEISGIGRLSRIKYHSEDAKFYFYDIKIDDKAFRLKLLKDERNFQAKVFDSIKMNLLIKHDGFIEVPTIVDFDQDSGWILEKALETYNFRNDTDAIARLGIPIQEAFKSYNENSYLNLSFDPSNIVYSGERKSVYYTDYTQEDYRVSHSHYIDVRKSQASSCNEILNFFK